MRERILELLNYYNLAATKLADKIGVQRSSISHILSGRNKPSFDFIEKILKKYPEINAEWLILGNGEMIKQNIHDNDSDKNDNNDYYDLFKAQTDDIRNKTSSKETKNNKVTNVNNEKELDKVEKVIIFYKNGTFTEYMPKN